MRIISQDGMIDVPYEMVALHECARKIRMNMAGDTGRGTILAEYSTEAKVRKAMGILHNTWNDFGINGYFQFPADDDKWLFPISGQFPADDEVKE